MNPFYYLEVLASVVATALGTDVITTRLVLSVLFGYPIAIIYSTNSSNWTIPQRQFYLLLCGVILFSWNFAFDIIHVIIGICVTMFVNYAFFRSTFAVVFAFIFNMSYLVIGSYIYNKSEYDINWTTPYCVLCLRLIGLSWDLYDASKPESARSAQQKKSTLESFPGILETFSFCFVPTAFISGPQFPMRHYQAFIGGSLRPTAILRNRSFLQRSIFNVKLQRTIIRFTVGLSGIILLSNLLSRYPAEEMLTKEFQQEWSLWSRLIFMFAFGQIVLFRYVSIWLVGEGACVLLGLGCTGLVHVKLLDRSTFSSTSLYPDNPNRIPTPTSSKPPVVSRTRPALDRRDSAIEWVQVDSQLNGFGNQNIYDPSRIEIREAQHTACANISLANLLLATNTDHLVAGFNINTNRWVLEYVYKRLRFLNSKSLSLLCALSFLALWHGTYTGYFVTFALEFITISVEKDFLAILKRSKYCEFFYHTGIGFVITCVIGRLHVCFLLIAPMVVFYLLQFHLWFPVLKSTYFVGFIYFLWPLMRPIVKRVFPPASIGQNASPYSSVTQTTGKRVINSQPTDPASGRSQLSFRHHTVPATEKVDGGSAAAVETRKNK